MKISAAGTVVRHIYMHAPSIPTSSVKMFWQPIEHERVEEKHERKQHIQVSPNT